ncbi:MAG: ubiquinol-cytochrome c reductase cytochrome b subunit, partial [Acidimicrobiaceae bacterium]|nr:ubiquinol-cytochrome c reductase cytochrome b subunit [Acidimicrobiaceae bacterium]
TGADAPVPPTEPDTPVPSPEPDGPGRSGSRRPPLPARVARWTDDRLGLSRFAQSALDKIFPDHWSFMIGEIALYCFVILIATGSYLTFFFSASEKQVVYHGSYKPLQGLTMSDSYRSVVDISFKVRSGLVMRQIHHWAAVVFLAAIVVHLCRIFFTGAFRRPREINWIIGVTLLLLAMANGFTGYSLPDDLLSGTGLRIAYSIVLSIPFVGSWLGYLFFGGKFPGTAIIERLFIIHVLFVPALIAVFLTAHLAILWHQKHTDFPGPGKTEDTIHGSRLWPQYAAKSTALFCFTAAVLAGLGGLAQINPIWIYGPYKPAAVSAGSQPDWYIGWLDGALRVMPPLEIRAFHHTIPNPFFPGVLLPGVTFALLYAWPFLEQRFSKDRDAHNLLDRPRDRPLRSAFGVSTITFYAILFLAAGTDVLAATFGLSFQSLLHLFQVGLLVAPPLFGWLTWRFLKELSRQHAHPIQQPVGGRIIRTPTGGYEVVGEDSSGSGEGGVEGDGSGDGSGYPPRPETAGAAVDRAAGAD